MSNPLLLILGAGLANNLALSHLLGTAAATGDGQTVPGPREIALATVSALTGSALLFAVTDRVALAPLGLGFLRTLTFALYAATLGQATALWLRARQPDLHLRLPLFGVLVAANTLVLGSAVLAHAQGIVDATLRAAAAGGGFALMLMLFAGVLERLAQGEAPSPFRGAPLALLTAGIAALGLLGLAGLAPP